MAYQSISTPRFYIDHSLWLSSAGIELGDRVFYPTIPTWVSVPSLFQLNPSNKFALGANHDALFFTGRYAPINYIAILGHNFRTSGGTLSVHNYTPGNNTSTSVDGLANVVNFKTSEVETIDYDGFSICTFTDASEFPNIQLGYAGGPNAVIGAISMGSTYTPPHSPDLSLSLSYEFGGIKTVETKGGASLSNTFYTKPPLWANGSAAWECNYSGSVPQPQTLSRTGRRIWDLSFSYLDSSDTFGSNQMLSSKHTYGGTDQFYYVPFDENVGSTYDSDDTWISGDTNQPVYFNKNILTDDNFYSQVIHRTNGGQLPFIFNPAGGGSNPNNNIDQFAICKFDMKNFSFTQTAPGLYSCKLKIREVW